MASAGGTPAGNSEHSASVALEPDKAGGATLDVDGATKVINESCSTINLEIHPSMVLFAIPLITQEKKLVTTIPHVNHNSLSLKTAYEITNNIANNALGVKRKHAPEIGNDMTMFAIHYDRVSHLNKFYTLEHCSFLEILFILYKYSNIVLDSLTFYQENELSCSAF